MAGVPPSSADVEQQLRDASRDVEQDQAPNLAVGSAQASGQLGQERPGDGGVHFDAAPKIIAPQDEQRGVLHRDDVSRSGLVIDQRQLAEVLTDAEHTKDHLAPVFGHQDDLDPARPDDEQRVARVVLEQDDTAFGVLFFPRELRKPTELIGSDPAEQRNRGEEIGNVHVSHPSRGQRGATGYDAVAGAHPVDRRRAGPKETNTPRGRRLPR